MNPSLIDPNNHAPELSPDDDWGDEDEFLAPEKKETVNLPPRRTVAGNAARDYPSPNEVRTKGLVIESMVGREDTGSDGHKLEVREFNGDVIRLEQSTPTPLRVARQIAAFQERPPAPQSLGGEAREWGSEKRTSIKWIVGGGLGVTFCIILGVMTLPEINKSNAARATPENQGMKVIEEEKVEGMEAVNQLLTKQPEAEQIFSTYAKATLADDLIPYLKDGAAIRETVRKHWHPLGVPSDWSPAQPVWEVMESNNKPCGALSGTLPDFSEFTAYFVTEGNRLVLDWKATTGFSSATFEELSKGQGADLSEIRGSISPSDFYTSTWSESDYQCYQLVAPAGGLSLWCYALRADAKGQELASQFQTGEILKEAVGPKKITVALKRGPAGTLPNQWLIGEMPHMEWTTP